MKEVELVAPDDLKILEFLGPMGTRLVQEVGEEFREEVRVTLRIGKVE